MKEDKIADNTYGGYEILYQEYVNNYLTVERFAEYYQFTVADANDYINIGRVINQMRQTKSDVEA